jgi:opacity protein-like surface antigen
LQDSAAAPKAFGVAFISPAHIKRRYRESERALIAFRSANPMIARQMKLFHVSAVCVLLLACPHVFAGIAQPRTEAVTTEFDPHRFEVALESAYLFGVINPPRDYQVGAEFITGRIRWGTIQGDSWLRGYNQFYISAIAEPIFQGIENHYFGLNFGMRYNFVQPGCRFVPYISGGLGLGWIDSHPEIPGGQGQDFTFNILTAAGISYLINDHWKVNAGILYQHLSNGGQTDPNPSLNLLGPQVGLNYSF